VSYSQLKAAQMTISIVSSFANIANMPIAPIITE